MTFLIIHHLVTNGTDYEYYELTCQRRMVYKLISISSYMVIKDLLSARWHKQYPNYKEVFSATRVHSLNVVGTHTNVDNSY